MSEHTRSDFGDLVATVRGEFSNFRDLGGLATSEGGEFRRGVVFRTQALVDPKPEVSSALLQLGLAAAVDLRMDHERTELPINLPASVSVVIANVAADMAAANAATTAGAAAAPRNVDKNAYYPKGVTGGYDMMIEMYQKLVGMPSAQKGYSSFLRTVANTEGAVAVFCAAGKDRTGWAAALLQSFAGVERDLVIDSYLQTNQNLTDRYANAVEEVRSSGGDVKAFLEMVNSNADYLAAAFTAVESMYGDFNRYLIEGLGLTSDELVALKQKVVM